MAVKNPITTETVRKVMHPNAAGLDVHQKFIEAYWCRCSKNGEDTESSRGRFDTTLAGIVELANWLREHECYHVCMESTGQYWRSIHNILERTCEEAQVVNGKWVRIVKDHKDDKKDAKWICDNYRLGMTKPSFIPPKKVREIRDLNRQRKSFVERRTQLYNQRNDVLITHALRLDLVFSSSKIQTVTDITNYIASGKSLEDDDAIMACVDPRCTASREDILLAVKVSDVTEATKMSLRTFNKAIEETTEKIAELERCIDRMAYEEFGEAISLLVSIPGIGVRSAISILSEIGADMSVFSTPNKLVSWAGLAPGTNISAGKSHSTRISKGNKMVKTTLIECALAAIRCSRYYKIKYLSLKTRIGVKKARVAIARKMLIAIWHILSKRVPFQPKDVKDPDHPTELLVEKGDEELKDYVDSQLSSGKTEAEIMKEVEEIVKKRGAKFRK